MKNIIQLSNSESNSETERETEDVLKRNVSAMLINYEKIKHNTNTKLTNISKVLDLLNTKLNTFYNLNYKITSTKLNNIQKFSNWGPNMFLDERIFNYIETQPSTTTKYTLSEPLFNRYVCTIYVTDFTQAIGTQALGTQASGTQALGVRNAGTQALSTQALSTQALSTQALITQLFSWFYILIDTIDNYKNPLFPIFPINVYIYNTPFKKHLPSDPNKIIGPYEVNSGFTQNSPTVGGREIVLFRKEECLKVFIHETFHCFNLESNDKFKIKTNLNVKLESNILKHVNLFTNSSSTNESYNETWAVIIYCFYKSNSNTIFYELLNEKCKQTMINTNKILNYNNNNPPYKENTSVYAYYILTSKLLCNYKLFMEWCIKHNIGLFKFNRGEWESYYNIFESVLL